MRKGENISKEAKIDATTSGHRIVIPVHIPHQEDYYKESYQIFTKCLTSLRVNTMYSHKISVISDACCQDVNEKIFQLQLKGEIDELIIESENIGKMNAILKVLRSLTEEYVTITDADIFFFKRLG